MSDACVCMFVCVCVRVCVCVCLTRAYVHVCVTYTQVWCEWVEMELRHKNYRTALDLLRRALTPPADRPVRLSHEEEKKLPVQQRLFKNLKLWTMYVDLEESLGTVESAQVCDTHTHAHTHVMYISAGLH